MNDSPRPAWLTATVFGLVVMIVWTVTVKFLVPLTWWGAELLAGRTPEAVPVMWDLWPLAHALLAVALWRRQRFAWELGVAVSAAEAAVVLVKFAIFLRAPDYSVWKLLWFTNKIYVLAFFLCLLTVLLGPGRRSLRPAKGAAARGAQ